MNNHFKCKICKSDSFTKIYKGKIRKGTFGNYIDNANIFKCKNCHVWFLEEKFCKKTKFYKSDQYRNKLNQSYSLDEYY